MNHRMVTECASCGSERLTSVLNLGATPPSCSMLKVGDTTEQERFPLELLRCHDCWLVQLSCIVDPSVVFHRDYPYSTGNSGQLRKHFKEFAKALNVKPRDLVVDIGANDGTFLKNLQCVRVAVEPTDQIHNITGIIPYQQFFTSKLADTIVSRHGTARYVTASNVLAHVPDPHDFLEGVKTLLGDDGHFVCENHDLASIVDGGQWDTVYHEHLRYYSRGSLAKLLEQHGLYVYAEQDIPTHGGSFRSWSSTTPMIDAIGVTNDGLRDFDWPTLRQRARTARWHLRSMVGALRSGGARIGAVGATARATTLLGYCGLDENDIDAVYEVAGSDKLGHYMPGTRIPVLDEKALFEAHAPEYLLLLSWHLADALIPKLHPPTREGAQYKGNIIVPLPDMRLVRYRGGS
jgi:hypothetical protein